MQWTLIELCKIFSSFSRETAVAETTATTFIRLRKKQAVKLPGKELRVKFARRQQLTEPAFVLKVFFELRNMFYR